MTTPFITDNPVAFGRALRRIARRERLAKMCRPNLLRRLCNRFAGRHRRERTVRIPGGETIHSNPAY